MEGSDSTTVTGSFAGRWFTTFGPMDLQQQGDRIEGVYRYDDVPCAIKGTLTKGRFEFQYQEAAARGEGSFQLVRPGRFEGQWREQGATQWQPWIGERGFEGIWDSSFGLLKLIQDDQRVFGFYEGLGSATVEGRVLNGQMEFVYREPQASGQGRFALADDGVTFDGQWLQDGGTVWQPWKGRRLFPRPGLTWLVVIEAHWQPHLLDKEYSFGNMLKEFFARVPSVQFSHRFFSNEAGLRQWCRDLWYVPNPVVAVIASHGTAAGLSVHGHTINPKALSESLQHADNVKLLHLSACLTMQEGAVVEELRHNVRFPVSGYTTSVDWAASAIAEFTYLDLILGRGLSPADAAAQLPRLLSFAGDTTARDSVYPAAGFRLMMPQ
jgi:hypothetical protein